MKKSHTYTFETSQPLTQDQINWLNNHLWDLPSKDIVDFSDIPCWITEIKPQE